MSITRREFINDVGCASLGAAALTSPAFTAAAQASAQASSFDINRAFAAFMKDLGGSPADAGGKVVFDGEDPLLRSHFRIGACMAIPAMGAALGAAAIWRQRSGEGQDLSVDLRQAVWNVNPLIGVSHALMQRAGIVPASDPIPATLNWMPMVNGLMLQAPIGLDNPLSLQPFETKDGRFINLTGVYPHLFDRILKVLKTVPDQASIRAAIKQWNGQELEDALAANDAVAVLHRSREEWAAHPQGKYLAAMPLIEIVKVGDAPQRTFAPQADRPLSGIKVISLHPRDRRLDRRPHPGRVRRRGAAHRPRPVASSTRRSSPTSTSACARPGVDLRNRRIRTKRLTALLPAADVFIDGFRGRGDRAAGLRQSKRSRASGRASSTCPCAATGGTGRGRSCRASTWRRVDDRLHDRRGLGGCPSSARLPRPTTGRRFPPTLVMNDYIAGYLGAAGIMAAMRRQAREGGSYHVRVSLARAAMWYASLGTFAAIDFDATLPENRMVAPETMTRLTAVRRGAAPGAAW